MSWPRAAPQTRRNAPASKRGSWRRLRSTSGWYSSWTSKLLAAGPVAIHRSIGGTGIPARTHPGRHRPDRPVSPRQPRPRGYLAAAARAALPGWVRGSAAGCYAIYSGRVLVVQERRRFYRESMTVFLRRQLRTTEVLEGVADAAGLLTAVAEGAGGPRGHRGRWSALGRPGLGRICA